LTEVYRLQICLHIDLTPNRNFGAHSVIALIGKHIEMRVDVED